MPAHHAWVNLWVHAGGVGAVAFIRLFDASGLLTLGLGGLICCLVYGFLAVRESRTADHRITFLAWLFAQSVLSSGLAPIYLAYHLGEEGYLRFVSVALGPESLASAYLIFLLGQVPFHFGVLSGTGNKLLRVQTPISQACQKRSRIGIVVVMWLIGLGITVLPGLVTGTLGSIGGTFERANLAALSFLALRGPKDLGIRNSTWWALLTVGSIGNVLASLTKNSKSLILLSLLPMFWYLLKKGWKTFAVFAMAVMVPYVFVIHPLVTMARQQNAQEEIRWQGPEYASHLFDTYEQSGGVGEMTERMGGTSRTVREMLMRTFQATAIGFVVEESDRTGFRNGETLEGFWVAFIPRALWPDKPIVTRGGFWRDYITGGTGGGAVALSAHGELYWNWGILGVALGMTMIGVLYGKLVRMTGDPLGSEIRMLLHVNLLLGVTELTDVLSTVVGLVAAFCLFVVLIPISEGRFHVKVSATEG